MRDRDLELLLALGILDARADEGTAFVVFGKLMDDPIMHSRILALHAAKPIPVGGPYPEAYQAIHDVVAAMTPQEKRALADRVIAACA